MPLWMVISFIAGQMIRRSHINKGDLSYSLDLNKLNSGVSFLKLKTADRELFEKFVIF